MFKTIKVLTKTHKKIYLFIIVSLLEAFQKGKGCEKRMSQNVTLNFDSVLFMYNGLKKSTNVINVSISMKSWKRVSWIVIF